MHCAAYPTVSGAVECCSNVSSTHLCFSYSQRGMGQLVSTAWLSIAILMCDNSYSLWLYHLNKHKCELKVLWLSVCQYTKTSRVLYCSNTPACQREVPQIGSRVWCRVTAIGRRSPTCVWCLHWTTAHVFSAYCINAVPPPSSLVTPWTCTTLVRHCSCNRLTYVSYGGRGFRLSFQTWFECF